MQKSGLILWKNCFSLEISVWFSLLIERHLRTFQKSKYFISSNARFFGLKITKKPFFHIVQNILWKGPKNIFHTFWLVLLLPHFQIFHYHHQRRNFFPSTRGLGPFLGRKERRFSGEENVYNKMWITSCKYGSLLVCTDHFFRDGN